MSQPIHAPILAPGDIAANIRGFRRHLRAENLSPKTNETYLESSIQLPRFLSETGMLNDVARIERGHVEALITQILEHWKPAPVLHEPELKSLLAACEKSQSFEDRRDVAILRGLGVCRARTARVASTHSECYCVSPSQTDAQSMASARLSANITGHS